MPTYVYRREDGSTFEIEQRITEEPLQKCPNTGQSVQRVISGGTGLIFKGSGFYQTDYVRDKSASKSTSGSEDSADSADDSTTASDTTTDSTSESTGASAQDSGD